MSAKRTGIVADPTQGLAAANDRIETVASAVGATNKSVDCSAPSGIEFICDIVGP
jgi:hypothetical protein